ncbi:MAG: DoxX family protein [Flavobacteriaceae bacterium]
MRNYLDFILRLIIAIILLQTLGYKFTSHPDSVFIFTKIGLEPHGRIIIGIIELVASLLILHPKTVWMGAITALLLIGGAIVLHLTILGIEIKDDGGLLFYMALTVFVLSLLVLYRHRKKIFYIKNLL